MNLEDELKIGAAAACGFVFGELIFYGVNGAAAFGNGFSPRECIEVASRGCGMAYYALGGAVSGALSYMWYYDKWPKWIYDGDDL